MKVSVLGWLLLPALGSAGWWLGGQSMVATPLSTQGRVERAADVRCGGGMDPYLDVLLEPTAVKTKGNRESLVLDVGLKNAREKSARALISLELVDVDGKAVKVTTEQDAKVIQAKQTTKATAFETPDDLPDGYYSVRVNAASRTDDGDEDVGQGVVYLQVKGGRILPMDVNDYYAASNANLGVPL